MAKSIFNSDKYFEQKEIWERDYLAIKDEKIRLEEILVNIPIYIESLLDVGCGNGTFVNAISKNPEFTNLKVVCGLDLSNEALKYVITEKKQGSITRIPFDNQSFNMVTSFEVLEHIKFNDFQLALNELERVAKDYILITVPNNEYLNSNHRICPKCKCHFHPYQHVRSFDISSLTHLFNQSFFVCEKIYEIGPLTHTLLPFYFSLRNLIYPLKPNKFNICPQCNYSISVSDSLNTYVKGGRSIVRKVENIIFGKERRKWLLALYKRNSNSKLGNAE